MTVMGTQRPYIRGKAARVARWACFPCHLLTVGLPPFWMTCVTGPEGFGGGGGAGVEAGAVGFVAKRIILRLLLPLINRKCAPRGPRQNAIPASYAHGNLIVC